MTPFICRPPSIEVSANFLEADLWFLPFVVGQGGPFGAHLWARYPIGFQGQMTAFLVGVKRNHVHGHHSSGRDTS